MNENKSDGQSRRDFPSRRWRVWGFRLFLFLALVVVGGLGRVGILVQAELYPPQVDPTLFALATALGHTATPSVTATLAPPSATFTVAPTRSASSGALVYTARAAGRTHLWAYIPGDVSPVQLTNGEWDDRYPAISPDGAFIAFSSNRQGAWDLFLLELRTGKLRRLTDTPGFESYPTWSPDGHWLACEAYYNGDFNIWIIPIDGSQPPIQLTSHPAADTSPAWDPKGRRIAFISDRDGNPDVFIANLEHPDDRFHNLTNTPRIAEIGPVFSPDGSHLAYSMLSNGIDLILIQDLGDLGRAPVQLSQGRVVAWSPDGQSIAAVLRNPNETHIKNYSLSDNWMTSLGFPLANGVVSLDWTSSGLPGELFTSGVTELTPTPLYVFTNHPADSGRFSLVDLPDISAPHPALSDAVDEAFNALRVRTAEEVGWDFLISLENAFVGLNDPLPPGYVYNDWLYTGRAFAFSQAAIQAGWVELIREDFSGQTYWRVFIRAGIQDGSLGEPLRYLPWDFTTRHNFDPQAYDQGGSPREQIPSGYYVDFTQLAYDYGFERLPALANWRTFYPSARFNEFVLTGGLDWTTAMLQLYPASAIVTPTPFRTPTPTPTRTPRPTATPWWWRWRTPTPISP